MRIAQVAPLTEAVPPKLYGGTERVVHWLTEELRQAVIVAKVGTRRREAAEAKIPQHLLYTEGCPRTIPTPAEASLLCDIRREVASAVGIQVGYTEPLEVIRRYEELLRSDVRTGA